MSAMWTKPAMKCENCFHFEVCSYVSHQLPTCDSYTAKQVHCADCAYQETCKRTLEIYPRQDRMGYLHAIVHSCEYGERKDNHGKENPNAEKQEKV